MFRRLAGRSRRQGRQRSCRIRFQVACEVASGREDDPPGKIFGTLIEEVGSQWTRCWRRQSRANPSLKPKFPASRENTGNFIDSGLGRASTVEKTSIISILYGTVPYASEQGIFT